MRQQLAIATIISALLCCAAAQPAAADAAKVPLKGLAKSGTNSGVGTTPVTVLDSTAAPSSAAGSGQVFVLTQACFRVDLSSSVTLSAPGVAIGFAYSNSNGGTACQSYSPGFVVPEGADVTCVGTGAAAFTCSVAGVVTKAQ